MDVSEKNYVEKRLLKMFWQKMKKMKGVKALIKIPVQDP